MKDTRLVPRLVGPRGGQQASPVQGGRPTARLSLGEHLTGKTSGWGDFSPCSAARGFVTCATGEGELETGGKLSRISLEIAAATSSTVMSVDGESGRGDGEMRRTARAMIGRVLSMTTMMEVDEGGWRWTKAGKGNKVVRKIGLLFEAAVRGLQFQRFLFLRFGDQRKNVVWWA